MENYYTNDWMKDYNDFKTEKHYLVLDQDSIFETLSAIHQEKLKIPKQIISKLK